MVRSRVLQIRRVGFVSFRGVASLMSCLYPPMETWRVIGWENFTCLIGVGSNVVRNARLCMLAVMPCGRVSRSC